MVKILFIADNTTNDFLSDAVLHGLHQLDVVEVTDYNHLWYMYADASSGVIANKLHGRGFTYYGSVVPPTRVDKLLIIDKLKIKYYDYVIYGNLKRCAELLPLVKSLYTKQQIIVLEGDDLFVGDVLTYNTTLPNDIAEFSTHYRRELSSCDGLDIKPISFAFPENKMPEVSNIQKNKLLANIIPGIASTFVYTKESDYYEDYRTSMFGYTWRKAGWDCLRHYEIICNYCIPLFLDIEHCPKETCTTFPKVELIDFYKTVGLYDLFDMGGNFQYDLGGSIITNRDLSLINEIEINDQFITTYFQCLDTLYEHAKHALTTKQLAKYILNLT
jgi:hypothetical protein